MLTVWVDETPYAVPAGACAMDLLTRLPDAASLALEATTAYFADPMGHELGLGGGLFDGQRLTVVYRA